MGLLQNACNPVILSQCAHWRENPFSYIGEIRIATPVCGLVRNDMVAFCNRPADFFSYALPMLPKSSILLATTFFMAAME